ncbi:MAG: OmpH family outer membrane protein [Ferruginibacter sp.]
MKKLILAGVMALGIMSASAQTKIGYINTDELIGSMPEAAKANQELEEYKKDLGQQYQDMVSDFNAKDSIFSRDSAKLSPSLKEIKRQELFALYQKVSGWQQQGQELYQQEAQKKGGPLRDKALEAIKAVAKESGYAYILDINSVIVAPPGDDVIHLVKKKLGIKDAPTAAPGVPRKN